MISLLFASALAQISTLNGNQVGGLPDTGAALAKQVPVTANVPQQVTPVQANSPAPVISPVTTPNRPANLVAKVNPIPFPGVIPLPVPAGVCNVNSQTLVTAANTVQKSCASECSSTCASSVKAFQTAVFECESTPEAQRKVFTEQLQVKISAQEDYCDGLTTSTTSTAATTAGPSMTLSSTTSTSTRTGRPNAAVLDGPALWLLTILFI